MKTISLLLLSAAFLFDTHPQTNVGDTIVIAKGQMPNIAKDSRNCLHIVYGSGDSIMYVFSKEGKLFTPPSVVAVLPKLFASAMRGPQIAAAADVIVVTACTSTGNIFSYRKEAGGKWTKGVKVNDANETAKEALMGLSASGVNAYAVWLGVKSPRGQNVYGAQSTDGGQTWSSNLLVYASPDSTVCECCKPSVVMKGSNIYVMFRNWLNGNRDLYLITSSNGGRSFGQAQKLGNGSWKLNGCPMDGGGLVISKNGTPETIWRREKKIYAAAPGIPETEIGEGRNGSIEIVNDKNVYAFTNNGEVMVAVPGGRKINLGKGSLPLLKTLNDTQVVCIWENDKQIYASVIGL